MSGFTQVKSDFRQKKLDINSVEERYATTMNSAWTGWAEAIRAIMHAGEAKEEHAETLAQLEQSKNGYAKEKDLSYNSGVISAITLQQQSLAAELSATVVAIKDTLARALKNFAVLNKSWKTSSAQVKDWVVPALQKPLLHA